RQRLARRSVVAADEFECGWSSFLPFLSSRWLRRVVGRDGSHRQRIILNVLPHNRQVPPGRRVTKRDWLPRRPADRRDAGRVVEHILDFIHRDVVVLLLMCWTF